VEGLGRLLILQQTLPERAGGYTLLVPNGQPFIEESLAVVAQGGRKMAPFTSIVKYDGDAMKLQVDEMFYADWGFDQDKWGGEEQYCSGAQLLPSELGLKLINRKLSGEARNHDKFVLVRGGGKGGAPLLHCCFAYAAGRA
jgi:hypothetical protein